MPTHLTGKTRFSVENLLYYAPKITRTGDALWNAVDAAQRDLLGLGGFWGDSWPDQNFLNSYPRAQYAMLIIARQLADEIIGIGGGIDATARTYGIVEDQNTADFQKIQESQARVNADAFHSGGWENSPPSDKDPRHQIKQVLPEQPPNKVPHPRPQVSPVPPRPKPGADHTAFTGADDDISLIGPWPSGDPVKMDEAAGTWSRLTVALDTAWSDLQRYTAYIKADAEGPAADAFVEYVDDLIATSHGSLTHAINTSQDLHDACVSQAQMIRNLKIDLDSALAGFVFTFIFDQIFATITFGATEALEDVIAAGIALRITNLVRRFVDDVREIANAISSVSRILSKTLVQGISSGVNSTLDVGITDVVNLAFGKDPVSGTEAEKEILKGGASGLVGGLFSGSATAASEKLSNWANQIEKTDGNTAAKLREISRQLGSGQWSQDAKSALNQLITSGKVTPAILIKDRVSSSLTDVINKHVNG